MEPRSSKSPGPGIAKGGNVVAWNTAVFWGEVKSRAILASRVYSDHLCEKKDNMYSESVCEIDVSEFSLK